MNKNKRDVSAQLSISSNLQCLHNPPCSFKCYTTYIVRVKQFVMSLPATLVQCEPKGEVGWYVHPKGENSMAVCGFSCKILSVGSLCKWSWKTVISPHRASMQCSSVIY